MLKRTAAADLAVARAPDGTEFDHEPENTGSTPRRFV
jgi:hypothetical protein